MEDGWSVLSGEGGLPCAFWVGKGWAVSNGEEGLASVYRVREGWSEHNMHMAKGRMGTHHHRTRFRTHARARACAHARTHGIVCYLASSIPLPPPRPCCSLKTLVIRAWCQEGGTVGGPSGGAEQSAETQVR